jgi:transposase InsO family protein
LVFCGSPTQNAYIESFNGTFRDECLDENWFESLEQARQTIAALTRQLAGDLKQISKTDAQVS